MAGYHLSSLDWPVFQKFVKTPSEQQLERLSKALDRRHKKVRSDLDENDIAHAWSRKNAKHEAAILAQFKLDDWYSNLSDDAKSIWEGGIFDVCTHKDFKFRSEQTMVYWSVIIIAGDDARSKSKTAAALSRFGECPYRFTTQAKAEPPSVEQILETPSDEWDDSYFPGWQPYHSLHTPDEVRLMIAELEAAEATVEASGDQQAIGDYENELLPALDRIAKAGRMLLVEAET